MKSNFFAARAIGILGVLGSALGIVMMLPGLLQGCLYRALDQVALLATFCIYTFGIWSGVQAYRLNADWQIHVRRFWLLQLPTISTSAITYTLSCGVGAWLYVRFGPNGLGAGSTFLVGSSFQWSYLLTKPESFIGLNVVAAAVVAWLTWGPFGNNHSRQSVKNATDSH